MYHVAACKLARRQWFRMAVMVLVIVLVWAIGREVNLNNSQFRAKFIDGTENLT